MSKLELQNNHHKVSIYELSSDLQHVYMDSYLTFESVGTLLGGIQIEPL